MSTSAPPHWLTPPASSGESHGECYIGLMTGTSLDGVDGVLCDFPNGHVRVLAQHAMALDEALRQELFALNTVTHNELHRSALAANALARHYAHVVQALLAQTPQHSAHVKRVRAIGAHGQTVRHQPGMHDGTGYTLQLNNPALLAELTGLDVVADFRTRDLAAGGQGAPLVPAFHATVFAQTQHSTAVLNLGGIANLTVLPPHALHSNSSSSRPVMGFDCGPGNVLLDSWCAQHTGESYDHHGAWAAQGHVIPELLERLEQEPFLQQTPPKSTGRDLFNVPWLNAHLQAAGLGGDLDDITACHVQTTLTEFTARTCAQDLKRYAGADCTSLLVCGGGALNLELMRRLQQHLPKLQVTSTQSQGIPPLWVESCAFAWLAREFCEGRPANLPSVTGAHGKRILGALYPA